MEKLKSLMRRMDSSLLDTALELAKSFELGHQYRFSTGDVFCAFDVLGTGSYGMACSHSEYPDVVFKVCRISGDGYYDYIKWVLKQPEGAQYYSALPRVYATVVWGDNFVVVMELLNEQPGTDLALRVDETEYGEDLEMLLKKVAPAWIDGHAGNVMIRPSTGEYVITDPIAGGSYRVMKERFKYSRALYRKSYAGRSHMPSMEACGIYMY